MTADTRNADTLAYLRKLFGMPPHTEAEREALILKPEKAK